MQNVLVSGSKLLITFAIIFQMATVFIFSPASGERFIKINPAGILGSSLIIDETMSPVAEPEGKEVFEFEDMIFGKSIFVFSPKKSLLVFDIPFAKLSSNPIRIISPPPKS
ncbi:MAG: hypothetical protein K8R21_07770 [Leptospira sp.]|nr:hypothetical protein [Leptospira sp.]